MATIAMTKLEAVNEMLEVIKEPVVAALDTGGTSIAGIAERLLDRVDRRIQMMGWPENTDYQYTLTPAATFIDVPSNTLWLRGSGKFAHRTFTLRSDRVYDVDRNTSAFSESTITVDIVSKLSFEAMTPPTKELILGAAQVAFQRRYRNDPMLDNALMAERAILDILAARVGQAGIPRPINPGPLFPAFISGSGSRQSQSEQ